MSVIEATDLTKIYQLRARNVVALNGLTLSIESGEAVGLLGRTGAGKTSLARIVMGLTSPATGELRLNGYEPSDCRARIGVGYVPENPHFPGHLTALGALEFSGRLAGLSEDEIGRFAELHLSQLDMEKWSDTEISKFSKDMLRRLALASALMGQPNLLIVDFPAERIDQFTLGLFKRTLLRCQQHGLTLLLLSHSLGHIDKLVRRVCLINRGLIIRNLPVKDLLQDTLQFEIEADIGEKLVDLSVEIGQIISVTRKTLTVELLQEDSLNEVIDYLRVSRIPIHSIQRRKVSSEAYWQQMSLREEELV